MDSLKVKHVVPIILLSENAHAYLSLLFFTRILQLRAVLNDFHEDIVKHTNTVGFDVEYLQIWQRQDFVQRDVTQMVVTQMQGGQVSRWIEQVGFGEVADVIMGEIQRLQGRQIPDHI